MTPTASGNTVPPPERFFTVSWLIVPDRVGLPAGAAPEAALGCWAMRYRPLGQSGLLVSVVGLGCNNFGSRLDVDGTRAVVDAAIDAGITLFDTSDTYGGTAARSAPWARSSARAATRWCWPRSSVIRRRTWDTARRPARRAAAPTSGAP